MSGREREETFIIYHLLVYPKAKLHVYKHCMVTIIIRPIVTKFRTECNWFEVYGHDGHRKGDLRRVEDPATRVEAYSRQTDYLITMLLLRPPKCTASVGRHFREDKARRSSIEQSKPAREHVSTVDSEMQTWGRMLFLATTKYVHVLTAAWVARTWRKQ